MDDKNLPGENQRIKEIVDREKCAPSTFADNIKINRATISNILNGRDDKDGKKYYPTPSLEVFQNILNTYKNINPDWLILGTLPMYKGEKVSIEPDLFSENRVNPVHNTPKPEYPREIEVKKEEEPPKPVKSQSLMPELSLSENIDKIVIFFKNKTYVTLKPEE
ncbi:MAG: helix-turn-helix domain-containing protein [Candidatus Symbiothrix sp.]|jgi:transcriptional regulator with XRE-family HTH domain|nr:helix-turn-helix domain-containing protein [Candidatus Symbiothrix sp.]